MGNGNLGALARIVALLLLAVAVWGLSKYGYAKPDVLASNAPAAEFSAGRAYATLGGVLGPEISHPVSTQENAAVRARIQAEFAKLGIKSTTYTAFTCNTWRGFNYIPCATVTDILAEIVPGQGKAIVLLAHYDSVPAGPGASDDESGVAIVLETARALQARGGRSRHPVLAVITDGEEAGLLGANAFLQNPALKSRVGVVVNVEARGTRGRSLLFQTSPGDSALIDLYARGVPFYATSSLFAEIYRFLPNDTDLTLFIRQGFPSFNFAFSDNVANYHTPLDRRENLSKLTLQEQGGNMLGVAAQLEQTDYSALAGHKEVYLDLFGFAVPRLAASWGGPLSILVLIVLLFAAFRASAQGAQGWLRATLLPPVLLIACGAIGFVLHTLAQLISGQPDPSYAYPIALREGLAFGVAAMVVLVARFGDPRAALFGAWIWFAAFGVATAFLLPGISPYFLFPAILAAIAAVAAMVLPERATNWIFAVPTLLALIVWIGLAAQGEGLLGLKLHALFTVPAAFAAMVLVPLLDARAMRRGVWLGSIAALLGASLIATAIAGFQPAFSHTMPQRLDIRYVEDATTKKASFALDATAPLPAPLRAAAAFSSEPEQVLPDPFPKFYRAPAGAAQLPPPTAKIVADSMGSSGLTIGWRRVTLALHGSAEAVTMGIVIPKGIKVQSIDIHGQHLVPPKDQTGPILIVCASRDCANEVVTIQKETSFGFTLQIAEQRYGTSPFAAKLAAARPRQAIPSQTGDITLLANTVKIPN